MNTLKRHKKRAVRTRSKISVTGQRPRLTVFRSNKQIYAQLIDDTKGKTLVAFSSKNLDVKTVKGKTKQEISILVGEGVAKMARTKQISKIVFDKGPYKYHGRVKSVAEGARKGGLIF